MEECKCEDARCRKEAGSIFRVLRRPGFVSSVEHRKVTNEETEMGCQGGERDGWRSSKHEPAKEGVSTGK